MRKISDETRQKMRDAKLGKPGSNKGKHWEIQDTSKMKGRTPWNKGVPMSEEAKQKMVAKKVGRPSKRKGERLSDEHRQRLSDAHIGQEPWNKGKHCPQSSGEHHWNWKGGATSETKKRTNTPEWNELRKQVYERDKWTCQVCGKHCSDDIQCHHVIPYDLGGEDEMDNLITLCKACHLKEHHLLRSEATGILAA